MDFYWIHCVLFSTLALIIQSIDAYSDIDARLVVKKYVEKGSSLTLRCEHNVDPRILYKVTWLKENHGKFFQFIKNRTPPYRNFSIPGAVLDWKNSDETKVHLEKLDFDAGGKYYCEVSSDTPIFTKESNVEQVHIIVHQTAPPRMTFSKRVFSTDENLVANCTTTKAHPAPHITWLINGVQVDDKYIKNVHLYSGGSRNAHRKPNAQQRDKHGSSSTTHLRNLASALPYARTSADWQLEEPLAANGNHLGFEIYQYGGSSNLDGNGNGFNVFDYESSNINTDVYDYDQKPYDGGKRHKATLHRSTYHKNRRHANDFAAPTASSTSMRHRLVATNSQLSIEVQGLEPLNGRLEISCLATIPAHVQSGEQYTDYKTYSVKIDIDQGEKTTQIPAVSDMAALGNTSSAHSFHKLATASRPINFSIIPIVLCALGVSSVFVS